MGILSRYDELNNLDAVADSLTGPAAPAPGVTIVHERAVQVLEGLLSMSESASGDAPPQVRALLLMLRRLRPMMLESFSRVAPAEIRSLMVDLREQIQTVIDAADELAAGDTAAGH